MKRIYTKQQGTAALEAVGIVGMPATSMPAVNALVNEALCRMAHTVSLANGRTDSGTMMCEPEVDFAYDETVPGDCAEVRRRIALLRLFKLRHADAQMWLYEERETRKHAAWRRARDEGRSLAERVDSARHVFLTHYARSAAAALDPTDPLSFVWHPGPEEYLRHYVHAFSDWIRDSFGADVLDDLMQRYSRPGRLSLDRGRTYWLGDRFAGDWLQ